MFCHAQSQLTDESKYALKSPVPSPKKNKKKNKNIEQARKQA
jgi:hypothetical protein